MKKLFMFLVVLFAFTAIAHAANPRDELKQLSIQLQSNPNDTALREKIIKLAQTIKPAPALPEEAERRMARGIAAFKAAKNENGFKEAVREFEQATLAAPWFGDAYYNLGVAYDKAEQYEAALRSLSFARLSSLDSKEIRDLIYQIEYRNEKAKSPEAVAARRTEKLYRSLDGGVWKQVSNYAYNYNNRSEWPKTYTTNPKLFIEVHGAQMINYQADRPGGNRVEERFKANFNSLAFETSKGEDRYKIIISEDGQSIVTEIWAMPQPSMYWKQEYQRIK